MPTPSLTRRPTRSSVRRRRPLAVLLAALPLTVAGTLPAGAVAQAPDARVTTGSWSPLTASPSPNFANAAVARTADGLQHVVWLVDNPDRTHNYEHTTIDAAGRQGPVSKVLPVNWAGLSTPVALGVNADGSLRLAFKGSVDGDTASFFSNKGVYTAVSADGGASWVVPREVLATSITDGGVTMTYLPDGTPITGYGDTGGFHWSTGTVPEAGLPTATVSEFTDHDAVAPTLVRSGAAVWVVYQSVKAGGLFARQVWPTLGAPVRGPGGYTNPGSPTPVVDRPGVGPVVAHTVNADVVLWDVLANRTHTVPGMRGPTNVSLAVLPDGHLWVGAQGPIGYKPRASRVSARGWTIDRQPVLLPELYSTFELTISSTAALRAELLLTGNDSGAATRVHARSVLAQLTLKATPRSWRGTRKVKFKVTDVDGAVAGVKVRGGGKSCRTNRSGVCRIRYARRPGSFTVKATKASYVAAKVKLKARR